MKLIRKRKFLSAFRPGNSGTLSNQMSEGGPLKNKNGEKEKQYCLISAIFLQEKTAEKTKEKLFTE